MNSNDIQIKIIYATQTGNAKIVANELFELLTVNYYRSVIISIDEYDYLNLPDENKLVIFVVSTTGYGEIPSKMKDFWNFLLRKDLSEDSLIDLNYTIFGLGDSSYELFNSAAKMLDKRLEQLGANCIFQLGLGDDQHDFCWEGEFEFWSENLITKLNKLYWNKIIPIVKDKRLSHSLDIMVVVYNEYKNESVNKIPQLDDNSNNCMIGKGGVINECKIVSTIYEDENKDNEINDKLYKNNIQESSKISKINYEEIDITERKTLLKMSIKNKSEKENIIPGDVISIFPENSDTQVEKILEIIDFSNYKHDDKVAVLYKNRLMQFVTPNNPNKSSFISVFDLIKYYLNIQGIPTRKFCYEMARYTPPIEELKEKLFLFGSRSFEGKNEFYRYCYKAKKSYLDIIHDFQFKKSEVKVPLDLLVDLIGFTRGREFSLANCVVNNSEVFYDINISLHAYFNMFRIKKLGVCSEYIFKKSCLLNNSELNKDTVDNRNFIRYSIINGTFPKSELETNYILICTGTGVSPFLYFLRYREKRINEKLDNKESIKNLGSVILFYGCRYREKDCIDNEYLDYLSENSKYNLKVHYAFSRENILTKNYVQHIIKNYSKKISELYTLNTQVVIVGGSKIFPKIILKELSLIHESFSISEFENKGDSLAKNCSCNINNCKFDNIIKRVYIECW